MKTNSEIRGQKCTFQLIKSKTPRAAKGASHSGETPALECSSTTVYTPAMAETVYGPTKRGGCGTNGISTSAQRGNKVYIWNWIWGGNFARMNGYKNLPKSVRCITTGESVDFKYEDGVLHFLNLPDRSPDDILNFAVFEMDFGDEEPRYNLVPQNMMQFMNI